MKHNIKTILVGPYIMRIIVKSSAGRYNYRIKQFSSIWDYFLMQVKYCNFNDC